MRTRRLTRFAVSTAAALAVAACTATGRDVVLPPSATFLSFLSRAVSDGNVVVERDIAYGPLARQRLDVYRPVAGGETGPIAIFLYGGAWVGGDRSIYAFAGSALAARGITTVVPDYRLFPEVRFPGFVEDAAAAYAWAARTLAAGCSDRPIVIVGHSAGAHIGALLAMDGGYLARAGAGNHRPAGFVGLAGPYAFDPTTWSTTKEIFSGLGDPDIARPVALVRPGAPDALLLHGLDDDTVTPDATRVFAEALARAGARVEKLELEDVGHIGVVTALSRPLRGSAPVLEAIVNFAKSRQSSTPAGCAAGTGVAKPS